MSAADVELVRELYDAFNRGEYERASSMLHEDVELHQPPEMPGGDSYFGRQEFARGLARWLSEFESGFQYRPTEMIDAEGGVFMRLSYSGRGRASGVELEEEWFNVWEVRDGRPFRCRIFSREDAAREAAGLARR
jgi:ketosteroid isomerase-like protein